MSFRENRNSGKNWISGQARNDNLEKIYIVMYRNRGVQGKLLQRFIKRRSSERALSTETLRNSKNLFSQEGR